MTQSTKPGEAGANPVKIAIWYDYI
jgi:hypothetical protein